MTQFDAERNEIIFLIRFLRFMCKSHSLPETGTFFRVDADIDTLLRFHATREIPLAWEKETFSPLLRDVARQTLSESTCPTDVFFVVDLWCFSCCYTLFLKAFLLSPFTNLVAIGVWQKTCLRFFRLFPNVCRLSIPFIFIFTLSSGKKYYYYFFVTTGSRLHHTRDKNKRKSNSSNCC